jgi:hypothetical protein
MVSVKAHIKASGTKVAAYSRDWPGGKRQAAIFVSIGLLVIGMSSVSPGRANTPRGQTVYPVKLENFPSSPPMPKVSYPVDLSGGGR